MNNLDKQFLDKKLKDQPIKTSFINKLKSYFSLHKKEKEVVTLEQIEKLIDAKFKQFEKVKPEEEEEDLDIKDPKKVIKLFQKVCEKKYKVSPTHMIQKTAMHYLIETGGIPKSDSILDRASRAAEVMDKTFSMIDRIEGQKSLDVEYMRKLIDEIEMGIHLMNKIKQLEPKKELTPQEIMTYIQSVMKTINVLKAAKSKQTLEVSDLGFDTQPFKE